MSESAADPVTPSRSSQSTRGWFVRGLLAGATSIQGYVLVASYFGYGGLCASIGFPLGAAVFSSALIAALPSQLLLVGGYSAGNAALVIAIAVTLSAARLFPSVVTLLPYLRARLPVQLVAAHFVAVSSWVESRRLLPPLEPAGRLPFYFGLVFAFNVAFIAATFAGYVLAARLPHALSAGLVFLTPISFLLALTRNSRDLVDYLSLALGLAVTPFFAEFGGRFDLLWIGIVGGGAAWLVHRLRKRAA